MIFYNHAVAQSYLTVTPWTAARQASLSFTISLSLLKLTSIESVMPSIHLILCYPFLPLPSIFPSIRVFSSESALWIWWPKYWSFSYSIMDYHVLISLFRLNSELWWTADSRCVYHWMCSMLVVQKGVWCRPWPQGRSLGNRPGCCHRERWWPDHSQPPSYRRRGSEPGRLTESPRSYLLDPDRGRCCGPRAPHFT